MKVRSSLHNNEARDSMQSQLHSGILLSSSLSYAKSLNFEKLEISTVQLIVKFNAWMKPFMDALIKKMNR